MELRQLHQFVAVAETLNFRRAAERLHMAQPPLSVAIRKLEEEVGARLFERQARGVALTAAGTAALGLARRCLNDAHAIRDAALAAARASWYSMRGEEPVALDAGHPPARTVF